MSGVEAMRDHRDGRLTLKTREVQPITVPPINADVVRETREALKMSRHVFAFKIGVNPRTLERWEQGRSKPNEQAAALIWLVRKYPDTLKRLESLAASGLSAVFGTLRYTSVLRAASPLSRMTSTSSARPRGVGQGSAMSSASR